MYMTQCKLGDQLLLRNGEIATMDSIVTSVTSVTYPYMIVRNDGSILQSVTEDGLRFEGSTSPTDVVGIHTERSN